MESINKATIRMDSFYRGYHNNSSLPPYQAWCELIDNSRDGGAKEVSINNNGKSSTLTDNGCGIKNTREDVERILRFNNDENQFDESKIGGFGLGFKEGCSRLGPVVSIWSKHEGCKPIEFTIDWRKVKGDYEIDWRVSQERDIPHGTSITVFYDDDDIKRGKELIPSRHTYKYYDRIMQKTDFKIIVDGQIQKPLAEPLFDNKYKVDVHNNVNFGGAKFDLKIGILNSHYKELSGFWVYSTDTGRLYMAGDSILGGLSAKEGLYVSIGLIDTKRDWEIDRNKRGVLNIDIVIKYLRDYGIIDKWIAALFQGKKDETVNIVENALNQIMGSVIGATGKEKRPGKKDNHGTIPSKNSGKKRKQAEEVDFGREGYCEKKNSGKVKGYKVIPSYLDDKYKFLVVNRNGNELTVVLNRNNKQILQLLTNRSTTALMIICYTAIKAELALDKELQHPLVYEIFRENGNFENINL